MKWTPEDPSTSVRSRSKNAAARGVSLTARSDANDDRVALPAPRADRCAAKPTAAPAQLVHERADDPRARRAERVAERDGAPVDVDAVLVDPERPHRVDRHRRECLVDLPQIDLR